MFRCFEYIIHSFYFGFDQRMMKTFYLSRYYWLDLKNDLALFHQNMYLGNIIKLGIQIAAFKEAREQQ